MGAGTWGCDWVGGTVFILQEAPTQAETSTEKIDC